MTRLILALVAFSALTACGANGDPQPPDGATVTGEARVGVTGTF